MRYAARQTGTTWGLASDLADDWRDMAACRPGSGVDSEWFYPVGDGPNARYQALQAKSVCAGCPVAAECLDFAKGSGEAFGIWGGKTPAERHGGRELPLTVYCQRCSTAFDWDPAHRRARLCTGCDKRRSPDRARHNNAAKTHCLRGHAFTPENTYTNPADGKRKCRVCKNIRQSRRGQMAGAR